MAEQPPSAPTPHLARVFEWAAAIMLLDHGTERLELVFQDGRLTKWWSHDEANGALELHRFDEAARGLASGVHQDEGAQQELERLVRDLLSEVDRLREELRLREESQIPVVPKGAQQELDRLRAERPASG